MVGRISYFPDDSNLRNIRKNVEQRSRDDLISILPDDVRMIKIAQNYKENEIDNSLEDVLCYSKLGVSRARNIIMKKFYESDFDYLLINDDDNAFYNYYHIDRFFKILSETDCKSFIENGIHCVRPIEPQYEPFKKENKKLNCDNRFVFKQCSLSNLTGAFLLINFKKYFGREFYFNEEMKVNIEKDAECEILDFLIVLMKEGYNCLCLRNMILKNTTTSTGRSTIFEGSDDIDRHFYQMVNNTCRKYNVPIINNRRQYSKVLPYFKGKISFNLNGEFENEYLLL